MMIRINESIIDSQSITFVTTRECSGYFPDGVAIPSPRMEVSFASGKSLLFYGESAMALHAYLINLWNAPTVEVKSAVAS